MDSSSSAEFGILGALDVRLGGRGVALGGAKPRTLLAALLVRANAVVSVDALVEILWGDEPSDHAASTLAKYVYGLRAVIEPGRSAGDRQGMLLTVAPGYLFRVEPDRLDASRFAEGVADARRRAAAGDLAAALEAFDDALSLWRGPALAEFADQDFARAEAARLEGLRVTAVEDRADVALALGRHDELVAELENTVGVYPLRERPRAQLMLALYRSGRQVEALRAFQDFRGFLGGEVGLEPSAALQQLEDDILLHKPHLDLAPGRPWWGSARRGASSGSSAVFPAELATTDGLFVGREAELGWLEVLWDQAVVAGRQVGLVVGASGVGKTWLLAQFARRVHARGAVVVYARCEDARRQPVGGAARALLGAVTGSPDADADDSEMPPAVEEALAELAATAPVLVVLDDLDRCGGDGLAFLEQLAAAPSRAAVVVMGVGRLGLDGGDCGPSGQPEAGSPIHRRELSGLAVDEVADLLAAIAGGQTGPNMAAAVHAETGGNPAAVARFARRRRDDEIAARVEGAMARADSARRGLRSVHDDIATGVLHRSRRDPGDEALTAAGGRCPYKGLARFEAVDTDYFCGRERLVAALIARLAVERFAAVVGASGSGKSSLLAAGLLPALARGALPGSERWPIVALRPGRDPLTRTAAALAPLLGQPTEALRQALRDPDALGRLIQPALGASGTRLVVVVDQFEEVFTACRDAEARRWLTELIVGTVADADLPIVTVLAVRADYLGACTAYPELAGLLAGSQLLIGAMTDTELRRAVTEPARRVGLGVEDSLVDAVCRDAGGEPGALPLVSTALLETWARRDHEVLTVGAYLEAGGVRGALARLADSAYDALSPADQQIVRRIMLRLAEPGEGSDDVRRRAPRAELEGIDGAEAVLAVLVARRLVTADDTTVEVAHEALLREWPRLRAWLEDDREGRRRHRQLTDAAAAWEAGGRDPAELYRGSRLSAAQEWLAANPGDASPQETEFVDASVTAGQTEQRTARRAHRRLRSLASGVAVLVVVALVAAGVAVVQQHDAHRQARLKLAATLAALARTLGPTRPDLALLLAVEGHRLAPSLDTEGALEAALVATPPGLERVLWMTSPAYGADITPDGKTLAIAFQDGTVQLRDLSSGRTIATLRGRTAPAVFCYFNRDATLIAAGGPDGKVDIWDVASRRLVGPPLQPGGTNVYGFFDPVDATRFWTVSSLVGSMGQIVAWDRHDPLHPHRVGQPFTFRSFVAAFPLASISADGRLLSAGVAAGPASVWDVRSHTLLHHLPGGAGPFAPNNASLLTGQGDNLTVWDARTGLPQGEPFRGVNPIGGAVFSPDGRRLAVAADDGVRVFDVASRRQLGAPLILDPGGDNPVRFLPDGRLITGGPNTIGIWRIEDTTPPLGVALAPRTPDQVFAQFTADGTEVETTNLGQHNLGRWNATTGADIGGLSDDTVNPVGVPAPSLDGKTVAFANPDGSVDVRDRITGQRLSVLRTGYDLRLVPGATGFQPLAAVSWSPDGNRMTTAGPGQSVLVWDVRNPRQPVQTARLQIGGMSNLGDLYGSARFSPDGRWLAADSGTGLAVFDAANGRRQWSSQLPDNDFYAGLAFTPDSKTLAVSSSALTGWQVTTRDVSSGKPGNSLEPPTAKSVAFARGGSVLVTATNISGAVGYGVLPYGNPVAVQNRTGVSAVVLYDTATLRQIGEPLSIPQPDAVAVEPSPDGTRVVAAMGGTAVIWDLDITRWEQLACRIAGRNLTPTEWHRYLPGQPYHTTCPQWPASH